MGTALAAVILAAQAQQQDAAEGLGISITPGASGGPGGDAFTTLLNYVAWVGYRVAALAFVVSVIALAFGRMNQHVGAETMGRKGMLYAAGSIALIAAADKLLAFAAVIGGQA